MRGKKTNLLVGLVNILLQVAIIIYIYLYNQHIFDITKFEHNIFEISKLSLLIMMDILIILNLIFAIVNIRDKLGSVIYILYASSLLMHYKMDYIFTVIPIISSIILVTYIIKNNFIENESYFFIVVYSLFIVAIFSVVLAMYSYKLLAKKIYRPRNQKIIAYDEKFFEVVEPLKRNIYINLEKTIDKDEKKEEKYGYVDNKFKEVIPFVYDFATPFFRVKINNKEFDLAGVSKGQITEVILKNRRVVFSYFSEYDKNNPNSKTEEFKEKLASNLKINKEKIKEENIYIKNNDYIKEYSNDEENKKKYNYSRRFQISKDFDLLIYESKIDGARYRLARKNQLQFAYSINVNNIIYDEDKLYKLGDFVPYYSTIDSRQGWIGEDGICNEISGKVEILKVFKNKENKTNIILKNFLKDTAYVVDEKNNIISEVYRDIYVAKDKYIVKDLKNGKWYILNNKFEKMFQNGYDIFESELANSGIYIFANLDRNLKFNMYMNLKLNYIILDENMKLLAENISNIYNISHTYRENLNDAMQLGEFVSNIKRTDIITLGKKYYTELYNKIYKK